MTMHQGKLVFYSAVFGFKFHWMLIHALYSLDLASYDFSLPLIENEIEGPTFQYLIEIQSESQLPVIEIHIYEWKKTFKGDSSYKFQNWFNVICRVNHRTFG